MACLYVWCILAILDRSDFVNTQNASKPLGKSHAKSVQSPYRVTSRKSTSQLKLLVSFNNHDQFNQRFTQEVKKQPAKYEKIFLCSILVLLGSPQWYLVAICIERCGLSQIESGACLSESCLSKMIQLPWFFWTLLVQDNIYFSDLGGGYLIICFFVCLPFCLVICPYLFIGHRYLLICSIFRAPLLFQEWAAITTNFMKSQGKFTSLHCQRQVLRQQVSTCKLLRQTSANTLWRYEISRPSWIVFFPINSMVDHSSQLRSPPEK